MTEKRFTSDVFDDGLFRIEKITDNADGVCYEETDDVVNLLNKFHNENEILIQGVLMKEEVINDLKDDIKKCNIHCMKLGNENEQLKKGIIGVVDRYIKNVECNPPSSVRTYMKIKKALINIREDLRSLISDLE